MSKRFGIFLLAILSTVFFFNGINLVSFEKVSMDMEMKIADGGYSSVTTATIFYSYDGKMLSYFHSPKEMIVSNNAKGEMQVYDPDKNTVIQKQNFTYGTETTQLYFFLQNKKNDLGLSDMGFIQHDVSFEEGLTITDWHPPMEMAAQLSKVRLVHEQGRPIYIGYYDSNDQLATKSYFYNYQTLRPNLDFPLTVTQINYKNQGKDSTINKTTYSNIAFDNAVDNTKFHFIIPNDAKVLR